MKKVKTWKASLYISRVPMYTNQEPVPMKQILSMIHDYIDEVKIAVTVTPTTFAYPGGDEEGLIIGFINYPRFVRPTKEIESHVISLADYLCTHLKQFRCTVEFPDRSYLYENEELIEQYEKM